jgi:hypothetical protein
MTDARGPHPPLLARAAPGWEFASHCSKFEQCGNGVTQLISLDSHFFLKIERSEWIDGIIIIILTILPIRPKGSGVAETKRWQRKY